MCSLFIVHDNALSVETTGFNGIFFFKKKYTNPIILRKLIDFYTKILYSFFKEVKKMKKTITITVSEETQKRLDFLCKKLGLRKSQAIALAVNTIALEKYEYNEEGEVFKDK